MLLLLLLSKGSKKITVLQKQHDCKSRKLCSNGLIDNGGRFSAVSIAQALLSLQLSLHERASPKRASTKAFSHNWRYYISCLMRHLPMTEFLSKQCTVGTTTHLELLELEKFSLFEPVSHFLYPWLLSKQPVPW